LRIMSLFSEARRLHVAKSIINRPVEALFMG